MEIVDFGTFQKGEKSSRTLDIAIEGDDPKGFGLWSKKPSWGHCEYIQLPDHTYRLKFTVDTRDLTPGEYQESYELIARRKHGEDILLKFCVVNISTEITSTTPDDYSADPNLTAKPKRLVVGRIESNQVKTFEVIVDNTGGPLWERVQVSWRDNDTPYASEPVIEELTEGQLFPIKITFTIDTTDAEDYGVVKDALVVTCDDQELEIPVSYKIAEWEPPQLKFSEDSIFCQIREGSSRNMVVKVTKSGSPLKEFTVAWEHPEYSWHLEPLYAPLLANVFPKEITLRFPSTNLHPGDYLDTLTIATDYDTEEALVVLRILPAK